MEFNNEQELADSYANGLMGAYIDPAHFDEFQAEMKYPLFGAAAPDLKDSGKGKLSMPWRSVLIYDPLAFTERQLTGDCVSHGKRNSADITRAVELHIRGESEEWVARGATEIIYGMRGHCGQGMSGSRGSQIQNSVGGVAVRKSYLNGKYDLSKYTVNLGARTWCPNNVPQELLNETKKHCITTTLIRTIEEARDALANGYGLDVCSNQGFTSKRDKNGFAYASGSWAHCMSIGGCNDLDGNMDFLIINSWGTGWISGPMPQWGNIPLGGFMAKAETVARMIRAGGCYATSNFDGFPAQKLPDYGTSEYL